MGSHSVTWHPAEVTFLLLPQPIIAGTRFSDPRGMQGWVDLVGLVTYQGGIPARRRSPIPVLTGLNIEQLHSYDERRYHSAKPPTVEDRTWHRIYISTKKPNHCILLTEVGKWHIAVSMSNQFWAKIRTWTELENCHSTNTKPACLFVNNMFVIF